MLEQLTCQERRLEFSRCFVSCAPTLGNFLHEVLGAQETIFRQPLGEGAGLTGLWDANVQVIYLLSLVYS